MYKIPGEEVLARDVYIGRTLGKGRGDVVLTITLYRREHGAMTIDHQPIKTGYYALAISGIAKGFGAGQIISMLDEVVDGPLSRDELDKLREVWEEWHLNDMQAACTHQAPVGKDAGERLDKTPPCPETGYKYGHAWLVKPLPAEIETYVRELAARLVAADDKYGARKVEV